MTDQREGNDWWIWSSHYIFPSRIMVLNWNVWGVSSCNGLCWLNTELRRNKSRKVNFVRRRSWEVPKLGVPLARAGLEWCRGLRRKEKHEAKWDTKRRTSWSKNCFPHFGLESTWKFSTGPGPLIVATQHTSESIAVQKGAHRRVLEII